MRGGLKPVWRLSLRFKRARPEGRLQAVECLQAMKLQSAAEILAKFFRAWPEASRTSLQAAWRRGSRREGREWPAAFSVGVTMGRILECAWPGGGMRPHSTAAEA